MRIFIILCISTLQWILCYTSTRATDQGIVLTRTVIIWLDSLQSGALAVGSSLESKHVWVLLLRGCKAILSFWLKLYCYREVPRFYTPLLLHIEVCIEARSRVSRKMLFFTTCCGYWLVPGPRLNRTWISLGFEQRPTGSGNLLNSMPYWGLYGRCPIVTLKIDYREGGYVK